MVVGQLGLLGPIALRVAEWATHLEIDNAVNRRLKTQVFHVWELR